MNISIIKIAMMIKIKMIEIREIMDTGDTGIGMIDLG